MNPLRYTGKKKSSKKPLSKAQREGKKIWLRKKKRGGGRGQGKRKRAKEEGGGWNRLGASPVNWLHSSEGFPVALLPSQNPPLPGRASMQPVREITIYTGRLDVEGLICLPRIWTMSTITLVNCPHSRLYRLQELGKNLILYCRL